MSSVPPPSFQHPGSPPPRPELPEGVVRAEPPPPEPEQFPRWPIWAPFAGMLLTLVTAVVGVAVIAALATLAGADVSRGDDTAPGVTIGGTFVQDFALIGSALLLAHWLSKPVSAAQFGLRPTAIGPAAGKTLAIWLSFIVFSYIWAIALDIEDQTDDLPDELGADSSTLALIAVAVLVCVAAPIAEEFFFRGFCFTALRRTLGLWPAAIITGAIFGAIHLGGTEIEFIVPLMVFGALLCLLYVWTGSLLPCIVLHALNNGLALGVAEDWGAGTLLAMTGAAAVCLILTLPFARTRTSAT